MNISMKNGVMKMSEEEEKEQELCKYCEEPMLQKPEYLNVCPDGVMCVGENNE